MTREAALYFWTKYCNENLTDKDIDLNIYVFKCFRLVCIFFNRKKRMDVWLLATYLGSPLVKWEHILSIYYELLKSAKHLRWNLKKKKIKRLSLLKLCRRDVAIIINLKSIQDFCWKMATKFHCKTNDKHPETCCHIYIDINFKIKF